MARYVTRQGDTWDVIAYRLWGQETLMNSLMGANPRHADVLVFDADMVLEIPAITIPRQVSALPPWFTLHSKEQT